MTDLLGSLGVVCDFSGSVWWMVGGRTSLNIIFINHFLLLRVEEQEQGFAAASSVTTLSARVSVHWKGLHALILLFCSLNQGHIYPLSPGLCCFYICF